MNILKFDITSNDVDCFYNLKPSALYMKLQEASMRAVESCGADSIDLIKKGLDWIIAKMQVQIYKTPKYQDTITIKTYPGDDMGFLYPRYWQIENDKGEVIVKASSVWGLLDINTRKLCLKKDAINRLPPEHIEGELPLPRKIEVKLVEKVDTRKIYFSEIDLNGHLNNCSYMKVLIDLHDVHFYEKYEMCDIFTSYVKELKVGDVIDIYSNFDGSVEYVEAKVNNELCFQAQITYKRK